MALIDPIAVNGGRTDDPRYPANSRTYPANQGLNAMNTVGEYTDTGSNYNPYRNAVDQNPNTMNQNPVASPKQQYTDALYGGGGNNGGGYGGGGYGTTTTTETPAYKGNYDLSEYLRQQAAARIESELAGLSSAYQQSMRGYDNELRNIQNQYYGLRNQSAAQDAIARRNFDERAAASGLNSGTAGQADLVRSAAYTGELARLGAAEEDARREIELQRANAQSEYEQAIAQAKAQNDQDLASALYQEMIRVQGLERQDALNAAKTTTASSGGGYRTGSSTKTSTEEAYKPLLTAAQARDAIAAGVINDTTRAAYEYYFGEAPKEATAAEEERTYNNPSTPSWITPIANDYFTNPRNEKMYWIDGTVPTKKVGEEGNERYIEAYSKYLDEATIKNLAGQGVIIPVYSGGKVTYKWA